jgi:deoxyribonuclease (pyrimidine dimer)
MRVNIIPVKFLADAHLRAEYREILMAPHFYNKTLGSKNGIDRKKISKIYTLNKGHAYFFYNKMGYIKERHNLLEQEMIKRSFKTREEYSLKTHCIMPFDMNGYEVSYDDKLVNIERILDRIYTKIFIDGKPNFYKYHGENMSFDDWFLFYSYIIQSDDIIKIRKDIELKHS